jgi:hypothetical protein
LRVGPIVATCAWALVVYLIAPFPQPWGLMLAATISIAVQLASPWSPRQPAFDLQTAAERR